MSARRTTDKRKTEEEEEEGKEQRASWLWNHAGFWGGGAHLRRGAVRMTTIHTNQELQCGVTVFELEFRASSEHIQSHWA